MKQFHKETVMDDIVQSSIKTLIVEDSDLQADFLESALNDLGITTITKTDNGAQAVDLFTTAHVGASPYSLVFLDIVMPGMSGQEALKEIRTIEKEYGILKSNESIIIMTTALSSPQDMMEAMLDGDCTDYLVKPVEDIDLKSVLKKHGVLEFP